VAGAGEDQTVPAGALEGDGKMTGDQRLAQEPRLGRAGSEARLIGLAFAFERATKKRVAPPDLR